MVLRLIRPDTGRVVFDGVDVLGFARREMRRLRQRMQMIFQDPYSSLDPRMNIADAVAEPLLVHTDLDRAARARRAAELLDRVGIGHRVPEPLPGRTVRRAAAAGRDRAGVDARPSLIVCDEPVAALDVSVRAQVLNLLRDLQEEFGLSYLFISHDLALVEVIADRVMVMAGGRVVEQGDIEQIFRSPREEYTQAAAVRDPGAAAARRLRPADAESGTARDGTRGRHRRLTSRRARELADLVAATRELDLRGVPDRRARRATAARHGTDPAVTAARHRHPHPRGLRIPLPVGPSGATDGYADPVFGRFNPVAPPLVSRSTTSRRGPPGADPAPPCSKGLRDAVHGGYSAMLLDGVMGTVVRAMGITAMTGTLTAAISGADPVGPPARPDRPGVDRRGRGRRRSRAGSASTGGPPCAATGSSCPPGPGRRGPPLISRPTVRPADDQTQENTHG